MKTITHQPGLRFVGALAAVLTLLCFASPRASAQIPATAVVPDSLPEELRKSLNEERAPIEAERAQLSARAREQNSKCKPAPPGEEAACKASQDEFNHDAAVFVRRVDAFNAEVQGHRIIVGMNALAIKLGWSADERERLDRALHSLDIDGSPDKTREAINQVWTDMLGRGEGLAAEAEKGKGRGMPGAGQQTRFQDCAIFALANSSGQPYGVVAARVTELMRQGDWRDPKERANPQWVIEKEGLNGGEVVMLTEALGRVEVVDSKDFAKTLEGGRPVMVNVWPNGARGGHEVVLTKTFQHDGETWFEMMDSNQGPIRRLYVSKKDLMMILQENGVVYSPEPKRTPKLFR